MTYFIYKSYEYITLLEYIMIFVQTFIRFSIFTIEFYIISYIKEKF